jgi:hypothetical protein
MWFEALVVILLVIVAFRPRPRSEEQLKVVAQLLEAIESNQRRQVQLLEEIDASTRNLERDIGRELIRRLPDYPLEP